MSVNKHDGNSQKRVLFKGLQQSSFIIYLFIMCIGILLTYIVCTLHVFNTLGGQKSAADSLELDLQQVGSCHADTGNHICSFLRAAGALNHCVISLALQLFS